MTYTLSPLANMLGITLIIFGIYAALVAPYQLWRIHRFYDAENWPVVTATLNGNKPDSAREMTQYSYQVNSTPYVSSELGHQFLIPILFQSTSEDSKFTVHYHPQQPSIAIAKPGLGMLLLNLLLAPLALLSGFMLTRKS